MARNEDERAALGQRLRSARITRKLTLLQVADALSDAGYPTKKATVSAWEVGRNVPDAFIIARLAKLYHQSADALLWDEAPSAEAMQFAVSFDALSEAQKVALRTVWMAFIQEGSPAAALPQAPSRKAA